MKSISPERYRVYLLTVELTTFNFDYLVNPRGQENRETIKSDILPLSEITLSIWDFNNWHSRKPYTMYFRMDEKWNGIFKYLEVWEQSEFAESWRRNNKLVTQTMILMKTMSTMS